MLGACGTPLGTKLSHIMCVGLCGRAYRQNELWICGGPLQIGIVSSKLAGRHPAEILIMELTTRHAGKSHWSGLQVRLVLEGAGRSRVRCSLFAPQNACACYLVAWCIMQGAGTWKHPVHDNYAKSLIDLRLEVSMDLHPDSNVHLTLILTAMAALSCVPEQALVRGDPVHNKRAALAPQSSVPLTEAEQAACLLDMATDANILGRAYRGWRPWL